MKAFVLLGVVALAVLLLATDAAKHRQHSGGGRVTGLYSQEQQQDSEDTNSDYQQQQQQQERQGIEAIQGVLWPNTEYCFKYNGQIASGYSPQISSQRSMLRLRCVACVSMINQGKGVLRIKNIVSGQRNIYADPQQSGEDDSALKIHPMEAFDLADESDKEKVNEKLELPVEFAYDRGLISNIQFHGDDQLWSKNLKKSLLNMLQLNANSANADWDQETPKDQDQEQTKDYKRRQSRQYMGGLMRSYLTMEDSIEGTCQTTYTILPIAASDYDAQETINVTKSIDFERCKNLMDVAYGYQVEPALPKKYLDSHLYQDPAQQKNTGSVIPKEKLDRSTTIRFVLSKNAAGKKQNGKFGIKGVELISKYVMKSSSAEASQAMQTVALAELVLVSAKDRLNSEGIDGSKSRGESLVYDPEMEYLEKVFFMRGDESNADVFKVWKKNQKVEVEKAVKHLNKLVYVFGEQNKKNGGIDSLESSELLIRLVKIMRMSTVEELKEIDEQTQQSFENSKHGSLSKEEQQQIAADLFANALVVAATRNTIYRMNEMIKSQSKYTSEATTIQLLKVLGRGAGLPAPSDAQVDIILELCQSDSTQKSVALKQSCWLTFGTMVGELAQQTRKAKALGITVTPMKQYEICPQGKMDRYKEVLIENLGSAKNLYEKILAVKCLGNAGLVSTVSDLKEIFTSAVESPIVRINAIDALRRLKTQISSEAIQSLVMPIYADVNEDSEVRMAALSMIMHCRPSKAMADQIGLIMANEKSSEVQSLAYSHMKAMSESPVPADKKTADYLKNALKFAGVDDEQFEQKHAFGSSHRGRHAFYSQEHQEGVFVDWAKIYSESSLSELPSHLAFGMDTFFNGQFNRDTLKLSLCQKNMDQIIRKIFGTKGKDLEEVQEQEQAEEDQDEEPGFFKRAANQLKSIFGKLKIKDRNEQKQSKPEKTGPYMFATFRLNNVDMAVLPLSATSSKNPSSAAQLAQKARQVLSALFLHSEKTHSAVNIAVVLNARVSSVPTSLGLGLRMKQSMYVIGQVKASTQIVSGGKFEVKAHPNLNWIQTQKMEAQAMSFFSGVKSIRTVELNLPLDMTLQRHKKSGSGSSSSSNIIEEVKVTLKVPEKRVQVFGVHTVAATFLRGRNEFKDLSGKNGNDTSKTHYHRITTIENRQLQFQQREVNGVVWGGEESFLGIPLHVKGNYQKPRQITSLDEIMKVLMAGDNNIHVDFYPEQGNRKEIQLVFNANLFQPSSNSPAASLKPRIQDFYSAVAQGEGLNNMGRGPQQQRDEEEEDNEEEEQDYNNDNDSAQMAKQQQKKLNRYLEKFGNSQRTNYKHSLKASVEVTGSGRQSQASVQIDSLCDTRLRACEGSLKMKRTPVGKNEHSDWKLQGQFETLYPEYVSDANELLEASQSDDNKRQQKFFSHIKLQWNNEGEQQQNIEVNMEGEPSQKMMRQILGRIREQVSSPTRRSKATTTPRNTPFLDKYTMVAQYNLDWETEQLFSSGLECLKNQYFWNSRSKILDNTRGGAGGERGLQIRGGGGRGRVQSGQVSVAAQIDAVTRQHVNFTIFTPGQQVFITNMEWPYKIQPMKLIRPVAHSQSNILTNLISKMKRTQCRVGENTVDTFDHVALKAPLSTCYTVLAKDCAHKDHPKFAVLMKSVESGSEQKKLKIITRRKVVEIEPQGEQQLRIKLNEEETFTVENGQVSRQNDEEKLRSEGIEIETDYQDRQAVIVDLGKLSVKFNGRQAKIQLADDYKNVQCGLCGNFNEDSSDELRKGDDQLTGDVHDFHRSYTIQDEECGDQKEHSSFYRPENKHQFGDYSSQEREVQPVARTMVMEYNHKLCFSKTPVKQCPQGYTSADDDEVDTKLLKRQKVTFSCIDRHSIEAKRIKNEIRRTGETSSLSDYSPSFIEPVVVPQRCVAL